jgi:hypothetical protein
MKRWECVGRSEADDHTVDISHQGDRRVLGETRKARGDLLVGGRIAELSQQ